ncbi:hypothetical protein PS2_046823 [Malus domestica]
MRHHFVDQGIEYHLILEAYNASDRTLPDPRFTTAGYDALIWDKPPQHFRKLNSFVFIPGEGDPPVRH